MSSQYALHIPAEQAKEMPMVDLAFLVLKAANTPFYYRDLMKEIAKIKGFTEEESMEVIAHLYTEINVDGRFACVGGNLWGLKRWYPVDNKMDEGMGAVKRPRIINDEDDDDEEDYQEEEETFPEEDEDFDAFDEDHEDVESEEEEEEETFYGEEGEAAEEEESEDESEEEEDESGDEEEDK